MPCSLSITSEEVIYSIKNSVNDIKRGDIFMADLFLSVGSEQGGVRPVLVIGNNTGNMHSPVVEVCCITSQVKNNIPTHVRIPIGNGLPKESIILTEHKRSIDKVRLLSYMTSLSDELMRQVDKALLISLGIKA